MKKTIKLAVVAALALGATSAFATNGSNMIGMGAKARGMAGTGIGMSHGAESALINPALITTVEGTEISFGGTIFMPDVSNTNDTTAAGGNAGSADSDANMNVIPEVSLATKINDNFYAGIGMWGTAGMGTDYRTASNTAQMNMVTNLQLMQFGVPLAYKINGLSLAITPLLQYGSLDINYVTPVGMGANQVGMGQAQDLQFGYNLGVAYTMSDLTVGATYKSRIDMQYKGFESTVAAMVPGYTNNKLSTPAEIGIGASYVYGASTIAIDYKKIKWSDAKGYKDFKWDDQNVVSVGYEYNAKGWAARVGYNYAKSPISEQTSGVINTFNLLGFPAIVESHYAVGGTYDISDKASVDLAFTYAAENTNTYKNFVGADITTKHSQTGVSAQLNYNF